MSEHQPQWQPTNPPTPPVQQQSWFARNKVLSVVLGVSLIFVLCCCGAGVLALAGDVDTDSTSSASEESAESAADTESDDTSDVAEETSETSETAKKPSSSSSSSEPEKEKAPAKKEKTKEPQPAKEPTSKKPTMSTEQKNAIQAAEDYLDFMPFSKKGLVQQLSSDAGDGYPKDVAEKAVEEIEPDVDWNEQAVKAAENYQDLMPMSRSEMINQLSSDAGEGFTQEQAEHAADEVGL